MIDTNHSSDARMHATPVGPLLREWRTTRRLSQLDLALAAGISTRHLSCLETGKSQPSRDMVVKLAETLEVPLRDRNALLVSAGYASLYPERPLNTPEMSQVRQAIEFILQQQEPYPAFLLNRHWDIVMANEAAQRTSRYMLGGRDSAHRNMLLQAFDPDDMRPCFANWEEVGSGLLRHLHNAIAAAPSDMRAKELLDRAMAYPNVPAQWRQRAVDQSVSPLLTTILERGDVRLSFFSTFTTFGTPRDITLDDLHIECCFPLNEETAAFCRASMK